MASRLRDFEYWVTCKQCGDQFSLVLWCHRDKTGAADWVGRVEKSTSVILDKGYPRHRCGGGLDIYGEDHRIRVVE